MSNFTVNLPKLSDKEFLITDFGAKGDGVTNNTKAINDTIRKANEAGGGKVVIPAGIYITGPIKLLSNINLHLERGSVLQFTKNKEEYPLEITWFEGTETVRTLSPIYAENETDIAITGYGVVDGNGNEWRPIKHFKMTEREWAALLKKSDRVLTVKKEEMWFPTETSFEGWNKFGDALSKIETLDGCEEYYDFFRPSMVKLIGCKNVLIEGVTLQNSPAWNTHLCLCDHVTVRNVFIKNPYYAQNGDGIDIESCTYVSMTDSILDVGDDAICMKSGKGKKARELKRPTEHVIIKDCTVNHGHGGFVIGSEMSRGVKDVTVDNCTFIGTDIGVRIKSALGRGGVIEDINISNIKMTNIIKEAIILTMSYVLGYHDSNEGIVFEEDDYPVFKNINFDNIICTDSETAVKIEGIEGCEPVIHDINFKNMQIKAEKENVIKNADRIFGL